MPIALTSHFELRVEVLSPLADLGKVRIAGHRLGDHRDPGGVTRAAGNASNQVEVWHQVRLKRTGDQISLWIDGGTVLVPLDPKATTHWLTFEPGPQQAIQFRNLIVEW